MSNGSTAATQSRIPMVLFAGSESFKSLGERQSDRFELHLVRSSADALDALSRMSGHPAKDRALVVIEAATPQSELVSAWAKSLLPRAKLLVVYRRLASKHVVRLHCEGLPCTSETIERLFHDETLAPTTAAS